MSDNDCNSGISTQQRKLYMVFTRKGVCGYFLPQSSPGETEVVSALDSEDSENPLPFIENAIYDNPSLIDDIPAEIIVSSPYLLLFPEEIAEDDILEISAETFGMEESDIFITEYLPGIVASFALCKGFRGFVLRTFPGIDVYHSSSPMVHKGITATSSDEEKILLSIRDDISDFAAFRGKNLLHASSRELTSESDILYFIFKIWSECGFNPSSATVYLDAPKELRDSLLPTLRKHINYARILVVPAARFETKLPLPVALRYKQTHEQ